MKSLFLTLLFASFLSFVYSQNVEVPDANFKNPLIYAGVDTDEDGEISFDAAEAITYTHVVRSSLC